jgi:hypothetical protein
MHAQPAPVQQADDKLIANRARSVQEQTDFVARQDVGQRGRASGRGEAARDVCITKAVQRCAQRGNGERDPMRRHASVLESADMSINVMRANACRLIARDLLEATENMAV